ncbi:MAG: response regulator transcription factor [Bdellovibrionales bacterium]|nr:response regulator transcription factor [Bdellovibrionales bacterium]
MSSSLAQGKPKLLVVDDEPLLREVLRDFLSEQFDITECASGLEAVRMASELNPDVILMDVMMPGMDGITAIKRIRENEQTRSIPVLMLTAVNSTPNRIEAFDFGADDYITKPFDFDEVLARVRSKLTRIRDFQKKPLARLELGNLVMDKRSREVFVSGKLVDLGPVEYGILELLLDSDGGVVSRKGIMDAVWQDESKSDRLIDAHLTSLRKKVSDFSGEIQTVYGEGYRIKLKADTQART